MFGHFGDDSWKMGFQISTLFYHSEVNCPCFIQRELYMAFDELLSNKAEPCPMFSCLFLLMLYDVSTNCSMCCIKMPYVCQGHVNSAKHRTHLQDLGRAWRL